MGRLATAAIITLALAGAAVESHAGDLPSMGAPGIGAPGIGASVTSSDKGAANGAGVPVEQLLADASASAPPVSSAATPAPGAPPPPGGAMRAMPPAPPPGGPGPMGWAGRPGPMGMMWRMHRMAQTWGLFFNQRDKNLSDSDVQILAEAILLVHGNHSWKVIDVADAADGQATFAYATADGSVIARFSIDRQTGRLTRIG